jgi:hypothetical protein
MEGSGAPHPPPDTENLFDRNAFKLIGFFDDTHTYQTNNPITGVAGFLYREETLPALEKAWSDRTRLLTKPFQASECRDDLLKCDLAAIVAMHRGEGFVSTIEDREFDASALNAHQIVH